MVREILAKYKSYTDKVNLSELDYIFECNEIDIAKYFIKDIFCLNPHEIGFNCIRETVGSFFANRKIEFPEDEKEFYITIYNELLFLKGLPRDEYKKLNDKVNLLYHKAEVIKQKIENKKNELRNEHQEYKFKIKNLNIEIKDLRKKFKSYDMKIKDKEYITTKIIPSIESQEKKCSYYEKVIDREITELRQINLRNRAISNCSVFSAVDNDDFRYYLSPLEDNEDIFLPDCDYGISIKFYKELKALIEEYDLLFYKGQLSAIDKLMNNYKYKTNILEKIKENSMEDYIKFLSDYIVEKNVCGYILGNAGNNHVIDGRREVIETAIMCYNRKRYLSFINIIAIQIEGIFYDYCSVMGIYPDGKNSYTLTSKLNMLNEKIGFNAYEYFAFDFPLIRNMVAHGLLINEGEIEKIAHETLLDLQFLVFDLKSNKKLPYLEPLELFESFGTENKYIGIAKMLKSNPNDEYLFAYLNSVDYKIRIEWLLNPMYQDVYRFYNLLDKVEKVQDYIATTRFWDFIMSKLENISQFNVDMVARWENILQLMIVHYRNYNGCNHLVNDIIKIKRSLMS